MTHSVVLCLISYCERKAKSFQAWSSRDLIVGLKISQDPSFRVLVLVLNRGGSTLGQGARAPRFTCCPPPRFKSLLTVRTWFLRSQNVPKCKFSITELVTLLMIDFKCRPLGLYEVRIFSVSENGENGLSVEGAEGAMPSRIFGLEPPLVLKLRVLVLVSKAQNLELINFHCYWTRKAECQKTKTRSHS